MTPSQEVEIRRSLGGSFADSEVLEASGLQHSTDSAKKKSPREKVLNKYANFSKSILLVLILVLSIYAIPQTSAFEGKGHMKLLAVAQSSTGMTGAIADLSLEVKPGAGRVFLETFPPTKEDTQISMRFAKQVACSDLEMDCSTLDFIYTIRAGPGIVGGPSAGAAAAVLTSSVLSGAPLKDDVAMTGTISSGGIVGPVGGVKDKIKAAAKDGVKLALIPFGNRVYKQKYLLTIQRSNQTAPMNITEDNSEEGSEDIEEIGEADINQSSDGPRIKKDDPVPLIIANMSFPKNATINMTKSFTKDIDLVEFGKSLGIEVREVATLDDAFTAFSGKNISKPIPAFVIEDDYVRTMKNISEVICDRYDKMENDWKKIESPSGSWLWEDIRKSIGSDDGKISDSSPAASSKAKMLETKNLSQNNASPKNQSVLDEPALINASLKFRSQARDAKSRGDYYSAASYCFRGNIELGAVIIARENLTESQVEERIDSLGDDLTLARAQVQSRKISSITSLQTSMLVLERLDEADNLLQELIKTRKGIPNPYPALSYANERIFSARAWSQFFSVQSPVYKVDESSLRQGCEDKVREASERYEYVRYYIPNALPGVQKSIEKSNAFARDGSFQRCLHIASLAKAEADLIAGLIGADSQALPKLFDQKMEVVRRSIARTQSHGSFPIAAYSYYEYAKSLKGTDMQSAMLFAEYALELSNLDMYLEVSQNKPAQSPDAPSAADILTGSSVLNPPVQAGQVSSSLVGPKMFIAGLLMGVMMMVIISWLSKPSKSKDEDNDDIDADDEK